MSNHTYNMARIAKLREEAEKAESIDREDQRSSSNKPTLLHIGGFDDIGDLSAQPTMTFQYDDIIKKPKDLQDQSPTQGAQDSAPLKHR